MGLIRRHRKDQTLDQLRDGLTDTMAAALTTTEEAEERAVRAAPEDQLARMARQTDPHRVGSSFLVSDMGERIISPLTTDKVRAGYQCLNCLEEFDERYPIRCPVCLYEPARDQAADAMEQLGAEMKLGSTTPMSVILDELADNAERRARAKAIKDHKITTGGVILPRGI